MRSLLTGCLPLVIAVGLPSQTTHLVGPGGLPQIRDALAIAAPGDVIHVLPGTYAHFDANVGVTIRALTPGTVTVTYDPAFMPPGCSLSLNCLFAQGPTHLQPPAGQTLHVVGVDFAPNSSPSGGPRHRVVVNGGRVTFDQCSFRSGHSVPLSIANATVHMQDCEASCQAFVYGGSPAPGVAATNSDVTAVDCLFYGTMAAPIGAGQFPQEGLWLQSSRLHGSGLLITGGSVAFPGSSLIGSPALSLNGPCPVWLSDSTIIAGPSECAIDGATATTRVDRCTITSNATGCGTGVTTPFLLGVERPNALQPGATFTLNYRTEPNGFVLIFASGELGTVDFGPFLEQPSWLGENTSFVAGLVVADATGLATASWPIPTGPFTDLTLWFKGISGFTLPLQASPPAGGVVR